MREDIDTTVPNLTVRFNEQVYTESEIQEFLDIMRPHTRIHASKEYTFAVDLPVLITLIIAIPFYYFAKGFFTKLGEKLGEEIGPDAVRAYRKLKETVARSLFQKAGSKECKLRFELVSDRRPFEVHAKVESSSESDFQQAFDMLEDLMAMADGDAREVDETTGEEIVRAHYRYKPDTAGWVMTYAVTRSGRILSLEEG